MYSAFLFLDWVKQNQVDCSDDGRQTAGAYVESEVKRHWQSESRILWEAGRMSLRFDSFVPNNYCFATSRSMVNLTSSPTTADGYFEAIPNAVRLIVVVAENPE